MVHAPLLSNLSNAETKHVLAPTGRLIIVENMIYFDTDGREEAIIGTGAPLDKLCFAIF